MSAEPTLLEQLECILRDLAAEPLKYQTQVQQEFREEFTDLCWGRQDEILAALRARADVARQPLGQWWQKLEDGKSTIYSDDFEHDAALKLSGDFATLDDQIEFAAKVARQLSGKQIDGARRAEWDGRIEINSDIIINGTLFKAGTVLYFNQPDNSPLP